MPSVFDFTSYKAFVKAWILEQPNNGHGSKSIIANSTQCNPAYVSQVLNGNAHFSLEQAEKLKSLLHLDATELDFFILLVERERAGTTTLKKYFSGKIEKCMHDRQQIKNRVKNESTFSENDRAKYYSSWIYMAVHMAITVPHFQDIGTLSYQLGLPETVIKNAINFLTERGLVTKSDGGYRTGLIRFHLPHDSDLVSKHHWNWRIQAMNALDKKLEGNLHYSSVITLSQEDFLLLRNEVLALIDNKKRLVKNSKEETLASLCLDLFRVSVD